MAVYTVQRGDTLVDIAQTIYGDPRRWRDVAALFGRNPDDYGTRWAIQPGQTVTAPADTPFAQQQAAAAPAPAPEPAAEPQPVDQPMAEAPAPYQPVFSVTPEAAAASPELTTSEPAPAPMETGPTQETRTSVRDEVRQWLATYDLQELDEVVYDLIFKENLVDPTRIYFRLQDTDAYRRRFAGNIARRDAGLNVYSEERYIDLENQYRYYRSLAGMPEGFYDSTSDIATFIGNDVSPDEFYSRLQEGYNAVANADPEVVQELRRLYNIGESDLAQFFLDPERTRTRLISQAQSALIAGEARQTGMQLDVSQAEMLQRQGVTAEEAQAGFGTISQLGEVFQTTTEEQVAGEQAFGQEEQIGAVFGTSAAAQQRLRQRARRRQAAFETGGRFAGQGAEITGLR
jgi:hypothetical protein